MTNRLEHLIGLSRSQVLASLGKPDAHGGTSNRQTASQIWLYGDIEIHFEEDRVMLVYQDPEKSSANDAND